MSDLDQSTYAFWTGPPVEVSLWIGVTDERGVGEGEWWLQPTPPRSLTFESLREVWRAYGEHQPETWHGTWHVAPDVRDAYLNLLAAEQRFIPTEMTNGGYDTQYRGVRMVANDTVPHGTIYFMGPTTARYTTREPNLANTARGDGNPVDE